jgi:ribonuclease P protein component
VGVGCSANAAPRAASGSRSDLTAPAASDLDPPRGLPRGHRLLAKSQFDAVHRSGLRSSDALFVVSAKLNGLDHPRLGLAVGVRAAGGAVARNRIKRRIREYFREHRHELPMVDLVVNARAGAATASRAQTVASLAVHWRRVSERCARS